MIEGVKVKKLKIIPDERGRLMEILRKDDSLFEAFGQVYMTTCKPGFVKAWHFHHLQCDNFTCVKGIIRLMLYDDREGSKTQGESAEFLISLDDPMVVHIPKKVLHGFEAMGDEEAIVINTVTMPYNRAKPDEFRVDPFDNDIPVKWHGKKGW